MYKIICLTTIILWPLALTTAHAAIYKMVDRKGVIHLTDRPNDPQYRYMTRLLLTKTTRIKKSRTKRHHYNKKYRKHHFPTVRSAAQKYKLDEKLLDAIIMVESAYNPNAISAAGAVGLMQLMPATGKHYGAKNRFDPKQNVDAGARYMRKLLDQFKSTRLALAAYNAGEGAVTKYGKKVPPYKETQAYVKKVLALYRQ